MVPKTKIGIWAYAVKRLMMLQFLVSRLGLYVVCEYPKSGGTWYAQMLSAYLGIPFPRNMMAPRLEQSVLAGHYLSSSDLSRTTVMVRDGRDVMVSFYYYELFFNEWNHHPSVIRNRKKFGFSDLEDIERNLPLFIEYMNERWAREYFHFTWSDFIKKWIAKDRFENIVRYEYLLRNPVEVMRKSLQSLGVEQVDMTRLKSVVEMHAFDHVKASLPAKYKYSFVRSGKAGDWRNHFSSEAREVFNHYGGEALIIAGYETDRSWVNVP